MLQFLIFVQVTQAQKLINTLKENNQKHKYEVFEMLVWGNFD